MTMLALADFAGMDEAAVKSKIAEDFEIPAGSLADCEIIVAYMSVGDYGCDSGAFIVFRRNGILYEVNGAHCSCHGFGEQDYSGSGGTQWQPEAVGAVPIVTGRSDWALACGGYDNDQAANAARIRSHLESLT